MNSIVELTVGSNIWDMSLEGWIMMQGGEVEGTERLWMVKSRSFPSVWMSGPREQSLQPVSL